MKIIEQTARASYGRLLATLVKATSGDIALAEDCLSAAFTKALEVWPQSKAPENPEGWLITTAKNMLIDGIRHNKVKNELQNDLVTHLLELQENPSPVDSRLELLFVCSHPAIDPTIRTPLMLQVVMGLTVEEIAPLFLVSPSSLEKKLTRAKQKIKLAQIPYSKPEPSELTARIHDVLEAIYGIYGKSWDLLNDQLEDEAIFLARLTVELLPQEPEPKGLLSLLLFCKSRQQARRIEGHYVPLFEQDTKLWDHNLIAEAEKRLTEAFLLQAPGRFQYEAAIQSAQLAKILNGRETDEDLIKLYQGLITLNPSIGAKIALGSVFLRTQKIDELKSLLAELDMERAKSYQPYWVLKAELSAHLKDERTSKSEFETAIGLTDDLSLKSFLLKRLSQITPR